MKIVFLLIHNKLVLNSFSFETVFSFIFYILFFLFVTNRYETVFSFIF